MTETVKTIAFVALGLLAITIGILTRPGSADMDVKKELVGSDLSARFTEPGDAKRLKIVRFDEDTATLSEFEVAEGENGLWSIPSKDGYPADATRQMAEAAMSLKGREILDVVSESPADHEQFGVIDPLSPKLEPGEKGVGTRVTLSDGNGNPLVDWIVGKERKDAAGQHFVREAGRDVVYVIDIDPKKLSTSFEDWIEKDLLKLNPWDLKQVEIKDYSAELVATNQFEIGIAQDQRGQMTLAYDDQSGKWTAVRLRKFDRTARDFSDVKLADNEQLNEEALNALKNALDDLKIVDVVRKPEGLSKDLKAGEDFMNNREARLDLMRRGFTLASASEGGAQEIISSDGEVVATLKDGVEYVLRFGNLTSGPDSQKEKQAEGESPAEKKTKSSDVHRYLFVMARFNEAIVPRPETKPLPELPAEDSASADQQEKAATEGTAANKPAESTETGATEQPADAKDEAAATTEGEAAAEQDAEKPADAGDATKDGEASSAEKQQSDKQKELERIIAERKRIEAENQRQLDSYQETLKKGREQVQKLNLRFGDWYFVVDNDVFNKLRLGLDGVIKKKEPAESKEDGAAGDSSASPAGAPGTGLPGVPAIPGVSQ